MSALAKFLISVGCEVAGHDHVRGEYADGLGLQGVRIFFGNSEEVFESSCFIEADCVVYTGAIGEKDERIVRSRALGKAVYPRAAFLGAVCGYFKNVTAIAGSHGKTTCTAMCAHVLYRSGVEFASHIGGEDLSFGNFYMSGNDYFVTEACEYQKSLLKVRADNAVLLNIDLDHMECYDGEGDLINTFREYLHGAKTAFVCSDDARCKLIEDDCTTFGITDKKADYRASDLRSLGERYSFTVNEYGKAVARIRLRAMGRHNVYNALAAFAAMRRYGFGENEIVLGLEAFEGVKRRLEKIGTHAGVTFLCDYAHHPREIAATLRTVGKTAKKGLYVVFQPHTYSRTRLLMEEFVDVLRTVERLLVYKTYPAREFFDSEGSGKRLAENVGCLYGESTRELKKWLTANVKSGDTVLFLGAGDIYFAAKHLLREFAK